MKITGNRGGIPVFLWATLLLFVGLAGFSSASQAMSRDVRGVVRISEYGILGGTLLGLSAYPMTGKISTIFLGSSVGLYLGLAIGVIYAVESDEPAPWQSQTDRPEQNLGMSARELAFFPKPVFELHAPLYHF